MPASLLDQQIPRNNYEYIKIVLVKEDSVDEFECVPTDGPLGAFMDGEKTFFTVPGRGHTMIMSLKDLKDHNDGVMGIPLNGIATCEVLNLSECSGGKRLHVVQNNGAVVYFTGVDKPGSQRLVEDDGFKGLAATNVYNVGGAVAALDERRQLHVSGEFLPGTKKFKVDASKPVSRNVTKVFGSSSGTLFFVTQDNNIGKPRLMAMGNNDNNKCGAPPSLKSTSILEEPVEVDLSLFAANSSAYRRKQKELLEVEAEIAQIIAVPVPVLGIPKAPEFSPMKDIDENDTQYEKLAKELSNAYKEDCLAFHDVTVKELKTNAEKRYNDSLRKKLEPFEQERNRLLDEVAALESQGGGSSDPIPTEIVEVSSGANHTLLVDMNRNLFTVGDNQEGQLGRNQTPPDQVHYVRGGVVSCFAQQHWSIAQLEDGTLVAWGAPSGLWSGLFKEHVREDDKDYFCGILPVSATSFAMLYRQSAFGCSEPVLRGECDLQTDFLVVRLSFKSGDDVLHVKKRAAWELLRLSSHVSDLQKGRDPIALDDIDPRTGRNLCRLACDKVFPKTTEELVSMYIALRGLGFADGMRDSETGLLPWCRQVCMSLLEQSSCKTYGAQRAINYSVRLFDACKEQNGLSQRFLLELGSFVGRNWLGMYQTKQFEEACCRSLVARPQLFRSLFVAVAKFESEIKRDNKLHSPYNAGKPTPFGKVRLAPERDDVDLLPQFEPGGWVQAKGDPEGAKPDDSFNQENVSSLRYFLDLAIKETPGDENNKHLRTRIFAITKKSADGRRPVMDVEKATLKIMSHFLRSESLYASGNVPGVSKLYMFHVSEIVSLYEDCKKWPFTGLLHQLEEVLRHSLTDDNVADIMNKAVDAKCIPVRSICFEFIMNTWIQLGSSKKLEGLTDAGIYHEILAKAADNFGTPQEAGNEDRNNNAGGGGRVRKLKDASLDGFDLPPPKNRKKNDL